MYYTDGTVDPDTKTTRTAVHSSTITGSWRTSNSASTMQTELIAIKQALTHSKSRRRTCHYSHWRQISGTGLTANQIQREQISYQRHSVSDVSAQGSKQTSQLTRYQAYGHLWKWQSRRTSKTTKYEENNLVIHLSVRTQSCWVVPRIKEAKNVKFLC